MPTHKLLLLLSKYAFISDSAAAAVLKIVLVVAAKIDALAVSDVTV